MSADGTSPRVNKLLMICHERHELHVQTAEKLLELAERQGKRIAELEKKVELLESNHQVLTVASNQFATRLHDAESKRTCYDCGAERSCMTCRTNHKD